MSLSAMHAQKKKQILPAYISLFQLTYLRHRTLLVGLRADYLSVRTAGGASDRH